MNEPSDTNPELDDQAFGEMPDESEIDASDAQAAVDAAMPEETRDEEIERLRTTADEADKRVLMAQAEAENFRKRMRRDFEDQVRYAAIPMVTDLLQVRDNLHRALDAAKENDPGDSEQTGNLQDGVAMVAKLLDDTMAKYGVVEIPAAGETFDPNHHEAISQMPSPDHESGMVVHVATAGFKMHDRVIRPAQVVVSA